MKKMLFLLVLVALIPFSAQAGIVATGDRVVLTSSLGGNGGGAFAVDVVGKGTATDFYTFCIEMDEHFSYGGSYYVKISDTAVKGGANTDSGDPLDTKTAFLYSHYLDGTIAGWTNSYAQNSALQLAIWRIEGEVSYSTATKKYSTYGTADGAYGTNGDADTYFDWASNNANGTLYGVQVMQLWSDPAMATGYAQDQLVRVPDGGATLMLLGGALAGIGALRRKYRV